MFSTTVTATLDIVATAVLFFLVFRFVGYHTLFSGIPPLPPGPKPKLLAGNLSDFPKTHAGRFWAKHEDLYGMYRSAQS